MYSVGYNPAYRKREKEKRKKRKARMAAQERDEGERTSADL